MGRQTAQNAMPRSLCDNFHLSRVSNQRLRWPSQKTDLQWSVRPDRGGLPAVFSRCCASLSGALGVLLLLKATSAVVASRPARHLCGVTGGANWALFYFLAPDLGTTQLYLNRINSPCQSFELIELMDQVTSIVESIQPTTQVIYPGDYSNQV